jgi:Uncharacterised nucleotidyltransferase
MARTRALMQLSEMLRGRVPAHVDWPAVLSLAGEEFVLPELHARLCRQSPDEGAPLDVRRFLAETHRRNSARNARLSATLQDALFALNAVAIEPVLLKGCALWATADAAPAQSNRMVSDLDLLVRPAEMDCAVGALRAAGFATLEDHRHEARHAVVVLGRRADVGAIDLHQDAPGSWRTTPLDDLYAHCAPVRIGAARARLPAPELQIFIGMLHDQFLNGRFWTGGFDMRRLLDAAFLSDRATAINWPLLWGFCGTPTLRSAMASQLLAAKRLVGANIPDQQVRGFWGELHYRRQSVQDAWPQMTEIVRRSGVKKLARALLEQMT